MLGSSSVAAQLAVSQEGINSVSAVKSGTAWKFKFFLPLLMSLNVYRVAQRSVTLSIILNHEI
jgi:hypothetical protein